MLAVGVIGFVVTNLDEKVTVTMCGKTARCTAAPNGNWRVDVQALPAGGPHMLTIQGTNTIEIRDVLVGEVWLCSGQSNMAMTVSRAKDDAALFEA